MFPLDAKNCKSDAYSVFQTISLLPKVLALKNSIEINHNFFLIQEKVYKRNTVTLLLEPWLMLYLSATLSYLNGNQFGLAACSIP